MKPSNLERTDQSPQEGKVVDGRVMRYGEWFDIQDVLDMSVNGGEAAGNAFAALDAREQADVLAGRRGISWADVPTRPPGLPPHLHQMAEELASGEAQLFDVREPQEVMRGKLKASILVPLSQLQEGLPPSKEAADPTKLTYLHCAAGVRVHPSAQMLRTLGFERVVPLQEGFGALAGMGFELES